MKKMIILDGNSIMFRAYYATAYTGNLMQARSGLYTNAVYGFVNMIQHIIQTPDMTNIFVAFDKGKKTKRHQIYSDYKGGRKKTPDEFLMQIPYIKEYLDVLDIKHLELDDYEADDIVGSMATKMSPYFDEIMVISGDRDLLQLAKGNIHVYLTKKGLTDLEMYSEENFSTLLGIEASQMTDYKGLIGDTSDNLPGLSGVGPKTASKLLAQYHTLENIISSVDEMKGKLKDTILAEGEIALRTKMLATLFLDVEIPYDETNTIYKAPSIASLRSFYEKMDFNSFLKKLSSEEQIEETSLKAECLYLDNWEQKINNLKNAKTICLDVFLTGENYHKESFLGLFIMSVDSNQNVAYYLSKDEINSDVKNCLENASLEIFFLDFKRVYASLYKQGIIIGNAAFDLTLGTYIVNPSYASNDPKVMYEHFMKTSIAYFEEVVGKKDHYNLENQEEVIKYYLDRLTYLPEAKKLINKELEKTDSVSLLYEMEIPLAKVLADMEIAGFKVDEARLNEIGDMLQNEMARLEEEIYQDAGMVFNIGSPKQLGEVLFEKLNIAKGKKNKTGYSTSAEVLEKLAPLHPVPRKVLEYRKYSKLYSTYVIGLISEIQSDLKVHTIFKQALTLTGRLSSTEPNIQNIPIRTDDGRLIRSAFVPSTDNGILISADYSQIELRILAHLAGCKNMLAAFNSGKDLHRSTAASIYNVDEAEVTKDMRRMAKAVNFGIVYGMSAWGLADELHISSFEASEFIDKYFTIYPEIKTYLDDVVANTKKAGYTTTLYNRRRYMPEINSSNASLRQFAERTAKNAPIQGTAADIIKYAMIKVAKALKDKNLKSKLIAQVHDELVIDTVSGEEEQIKTLLKETMESVVNLKVVLSAEVSSGYNWDMK